MKKKSPKFTLYIIIFVLIAIYFYNKNLNDYASSLKIKDIDEASFIPATKSISFNKIKSGETKLQVNSLISNKSNSTSMHEAIFKTSFGTKSSKITYSNIDLHPISIAPISEEENFTVKPKYILLLKNNATLEKIFSLLRIPYKVAKSIDLNATETSVIIFENYADYLIIEEDSKIMKHLAKNKIGLMVFNSKTNIKEEEITDCYLGDNEFMNEFLFITKNNKQRVKINKKVKITNNFRQLFAIQEKFNSILKCEKSNNQIEDILTVGKIDDIDHVFINSVNLDDIWLINSLFIDSIRYLSKQEVNVNLKRYVLVDIDDIFLTKINETDYNEMIKFQNILTEKYFNNDNNSFKLNLGMSGAFYDTANIGDRLLMSSFGSVYFKLNNFQI